MTATSIFSLNIKDYEDIDKRMRPFLSGGWELTEFYKGQTIHIPGDWNSNFHPCKYFEVIKQPGEDNYDPNHAEDEIGLCIWGGWPGYDHEVEINLFIRENDIHNKTFRVSAEILKCGGAKMTLRYGGTIITNFMKRDWFPKPVDKIWIDNMYDFF